MNKFPESLAPAPRLPVRRLSMLEVVPSVAPSTLVVEWSRQVLLAILSLSFAFTLLACGMFLLLLP